MRGLARSATTPMMVSLLFWLSCLVTTTVHALSGERLYGINYSLRIGPDWAWGADRCKSYERIMTDLTQLQQITDNVRVFSLTDCDTGALLLQATQQMAPVPMGLWLGLWVGPNQTNFVEERARLQQLVNDYDFSNVLGIHVSSESIYREDITVEEAIALRNLIKQDMVNAGWSNIPVTVADIADTYMKSPELIQVDNFALTANLFPFWEPSLVDINGHSPNNQGSNYNSAAEFFDQKFRNVEVRRGLRQIVIGETGWADAGVAEGANKATPASMAKWLRDFVCLAKAKEWQYFWFNAYDSNWRQVNEQNAESVEGHFGIFDTDGVMKPHLAGLVIDCTAPYWDVDPNNQVTFPTAAPVVSVPTTNAPTKSPVAATTPSPTTSPVTETLDPTTPGKVTDPPTAAPVSQVVDTLVPTTRPTFPPAADILAPTNPPTRLPTLPPTSANPTFPPFTASPTKRPTTAFPTAKPTLPPFTASPTAKPTLPPFTASPTAKPTEPPVTASPTAKPTEPPVTNSPTAKPTVAPIQSPAPTTEPPTTEAPTKVPTAQPTPGTPTKVPTLVPLGETNPPFSLVASAVGTSAATTRNTHQHLYWTALFSSLVAMYLHVVR